MQASQPVFLDRRQSTESDDLTAKDGARAPATGSPERGELPAAGEPPGEYP